MTVARNNLIICCTLCAYALYLLYGMTWHEAWRDEWQAINIARSFTSLPDLYARLRYEGHPALWFIAIRSVWEIHPALFSVQLLNVFFAVAAAGLVSFYAPWPLWLRLLAAFGGPAAWEYSVKARGYGLGWLLLVILALMLRRPDSRFKTSIVITLAVLALNTSVFSGIVAYALAAGWLWGIARQRMFRRFSAAAVILAASAAGTALLAIPPPGAALGIGPEKVVTDGFSALATAFSVALLPCHGMPWDYLPYIVAAAAIMILFCFRELCPDSSSRVALICGWSGCMLFVVYKSGVQPWYMWHVFLLPFAVSIAFEKRVPLPRNTIVLLSLFSLLGLNAGIREYLHDRAAVYSAARPAAAGIRAAGLAELPIVVFPDYYIASLSGYLGRPVHEGACRGGETYILWLYKRASEMESFACAVKLAQGSPEGRSLFTHPEVLGDDAIQELSAEFGVTITPAGSYPADGGSDYRFGTDEHFNVYLLAARR